MAFTRQAPPLPDAQARVASRRALGHLVAPGARSTQSRVCSTCSLAHHALNIAQRSMPPATDTMRTSVRTLHNSKRRQQCIRNTCGTVDQGSAPGRPDRQARAMRPVRGTTPPVPPQQRTAQRPPRPRPARTRPPGILPSLSPARRHASRIHFVAMQRSQARTNTRVLCKLRYTRESTRS